MLFMRPNRKWPATERLQLNPQQVWTEHPRPQLQRERWTNLNGLWDFVVSGKNATEEKSWWEKERKDGTTGLPTLHQILVPFCPESGLSGVGRLTEPGDSLWYRRGLPVKPVAGERTLLHFEAVDHETAVWLNDKEVGRHIGGNTAFTFDITKLIEDGPNTLVVRVNDATEGWQLRGKQALKPFGTNYTRVSGIWQTVWLEQVPERFVEDLDFETLVEEIEKPEGEKEKKVSLVVRPKLAGKALPGERVKVTVSFEGKEITTATGTDKLAMEMVVPKWWTPEHPHLYDLKVELLDGGGKVIDTVQSYSALRTVGKVRGRGGNLQIALNDKETFLFGPLDQGWWPDGLLTPPSDEAMVSDLKFLKEAGYNMLRKHVKVENARYYYWCDKLGLAVWQDQVSAGMWEGNSPPGCSPPWTRFGANPKDGNWPDDAKQQWITEYKAMVDQLRDHPSILIWSLFNESWGQHDSMELGKMAAEYDSSRLISIASGGNFWPVGDIASNHHYTEPEFPFADPRLGKFIKVCGEMGGFAFGVEGHLWKPDVKKWGYSGNSNTEFTWKESYSRTMAQLAQLRAQGLSAGVYTQTSDVENEINGLLTYDRVPKVDVKWLKAQNDQVILGRRPVVMKR